MPGDENLWAAPNLLLQKFPAPEFRATTVIDAAQLRDGERAGLIVFGSDYAWIGVERSAEMRPVRLRILRNAADGGAEQEFAVHPFTRSVVVLEVKVSGGGVCQFGFAQEGDGVTSLGPSFTARPGRWVGAKVGLFAWAPVGRSKTGSVTVRSFSISPVRR